MDSSMDLPMDHAELNSSCVEDCVEYCDDKKPTSDSVHRMEGENLPTTTEAGLFQAAVDCAPTKTRRKRVQRRQLRYASTLSSTSDDSSECKTMSEKIAEFCKNSFVRRKKKKRKKCRFLTKKSKGSPRVTQRKQLSSISMKEIRRRMYHRGTQFPFTQLKYLPFKMYFPYEQFVVGGFLNHLKYLKYEHSLKDSLKDMAVDEDAENESLSLRQYSYMDDDGPLSPISDPGEDLDGGRAEEGIEVVENSSFILDCQVPTKKEWRIK